MLRLVVVLPLQPLADGDGFALSAWPLHVTVVPTFVTRVELAAVITAIRPVLAESRMLRVRGGQDEGFGRSMNLPVTVIEPAAELTELHRRLVTALIPVGAEFDHPDFTGPGYRAHVTMTRSDRIQSRDILHLRQAAVVDMSPEGDERLRRVVFAMPLQD